MTRRTSLAGAIALLLLFPAGAVACGEPIAGTDWPTAPAQENGLDAERLCALSDWMKSGPALNPHAILIARHGKLVFEQYRSGRDSPWGRPPGDYTYGPETRHDVRSISKSVVSLLVGIAIDRGLIGSVEDPIARYLPDYADLLTDGKAHITIRHLLSMTSGLAWNERVPYSSPYSTERLMAEAADPYRYVLERPLVTQPGAEWEYSGGSTMLLSRILQTATGKKLVDFAREALFEPLGISDFEWIALRANGETAAYGSLRMRPRDVAKIGQLVIDKGAWSGRQIVSPGWIETSTADVADGWYPYRFGMHWWAGNSPVARGISIPWTAALGYGGQRIFVVPTLDLVVVTTAWALTPDQMKAAQAILDDFVLPAVIP
jgi:CubicO group peptidase (beta-lactamase class C family)